MGPCKIIPGLSFLRGRDFAVISVIENFMEPGLKLTEMMEFHWKFKKCICIFQGTNYSLDKINGKDSGFEISAAFEYWIT